jgi:hypothetical protein
VPRHAVGRLLIEDGHVVACRPAYLGKGPS